MKIIVLQGVSNSGKTSTVKKMIEKLLKKYPNVNPLYHNRTFRHAMAAGTAKGGNVYNVWIAIEINNKKIIIMSIGDSTKIIEEQYRKILKITGWNSVDLLVCCGHATPNFNNYFQRICGGKIIVLPENKETDDGNTGEKVIIVTKNKGTNDDDSIAQKIFDILDYEIWR